MCRADKHLVTVIAVKGGQKGLINAVFISIIQT